MSLPLDFGRFFSTISSVTNPTLPHLCHRNEFSVHFWRLNPPRHQSFWPPWLSRPLRVLPYLHGYVYLRHNGRVLSPERLNKPTSISVIPFKSCTRRTPRVYRLQRIPIQDHPSARHQVNIHGEGQRKRTRETRPRSNSEVGTVRCTPHVRSTPRVNIDGLGVATRDSSVFLQWSKVIPFRGQTVNDGPRFLKGCQRSRDLDPVI